MATAEDRRLVNQKIGEYVRVLLEHQIPVWRIYLFGSQVQGSAHESSDIDLAVFLDKDEIDGFREDVQLMRLRWNVDLRIEPHSFARSDFDEGNPFVREIIERGERIV